MARTFTTSVDISTANRIQADCSTPTQTHGFACWRLARRQHFDFAYVLLRLLSADVARSSGGFWVLGHHYTSGKEKASHERGSLLYCTLADSTVSELSQSERERLRALIQLSPFPLILFISSDFLAF